MLFFLVSLIFVVLGEVSSQTFYDIPSGECVEYEDEGFCGGYTTSYWKSNAIETSDDVLLQPAINLQTGGSLNLRSLAGITELAVDISPALTPCFYTLRALLCSRYYPPCNTTAIGPATPLPIQPCASSCSIVNQNCLIFFLSQGFSPLDCDELDSLDGFPAYSNNSTSFVDNTTEVPCNNNVPLTVVDYRLLLPDGMTTYCLPPILVPNKKGLACGLNACESPSNAKSPEGILAVDSIGLVLSAFLIVTFLRWPGKMKFPSSIIFNLAVGSFITSWIFVSNHQMGYASRNYCTGPNDYIGINDPRCFFQYTTLHLGSLICAFWWGATAVNLFVVVVLELRDPQRYERYYQVVCWGMPLLLWLIPLISGEAGFNQIYGFCWIRAKPTDHKGLIGYYFAWIFLIIIVGSICMLAAIAKVTHLTYLISNQQTGSGQDYKQLQKRIFSQLRTFIFLFAFLFIYSVVLRFFFLASADETYDTAMANAFDFALCMSEGQSSCSYDTGIPSSNIELMRFSVAFQGICIFTIFVPVNIIQFWLRGGVEESAHSSYSMKENPTHTNSSRGKSKPNVTRSIEGDGASTISSDADVGSGMSAIAIVPGTADKPQI